MKKSKKFIIDLYNRLFTDPDGESKLRRLIQNSKTGALDWSKGEKPFGDEPEEEYVKPFHLDDDERQKTRMFKPVPTEQEPFRKNRFEVIFPGIPSHYFSAYNYVGTNKHSERAFLSTKVITEDYSSFKILLLFPSEGFDICEKMKELELNPYVGDIIVDMLDPVGSVIKQIIIPHAEVTEIKAFRDLSYGNYGDNKDEILYGEIIVKHKQRKLK